MLDQNYQPVPYFSPTMPSETRDIFICKLSISDQTEYLQLYQYFTGCEDRNKRNMGLTTFIHHIKRVHGFVNKNDELDLFRGFACGIIFGKGFVLLNTKRLKGFLTRSKSCVNACFQKLGYSIHRQQQDLAGFLSAAFPFINPAFINVRQWCVRKRSDDAMINFHPIVTEDFANKYGLLGPKKQDVSPEELWSIRSMLN